MPDVTVTTDIDTFLRSSDNANARSNLGAASSADLSGKQDIIGTNVTESGTDAFAQGKNTIASGAQSHAEGLGTTASGDWSHAEGVDTIASGSVSHAQGHTTTASGDYSHAEGRDTTASGESSHAQGNDTTASGNYSHAQGLEAISDRHAEHAHSGGKFLTNGDAQRMAFVMRRQITHTANTWYALGLKGVNPVSSSENRLTIPTDTVYTGKALISGITQGCTKSFGFEILFVAENDGGTTSLLSSSITTIYDSDATDYDVRVTADTTNDQVLIEVSSISSTDTIRWVASVDVVSVSFPA